MSQPGRGNRPLQRSRSGATPGRLYLADADVIIRVHADGDGQPTKEVKKARRHSSFAEWCKTKLLPRPSTSIEGTSKASTTTVSRASLLIVKPSEARKLQCVSLVDGLRTETANNQPTATRGVPRRPNIRTLPRSVAREDYSARMTMMEMQQYPSDFLASVSKARCSSSTGAGSNHYSSNTTVGSSHYSCNTLSSSSCYSSNTVSTYLTEEPTGATPIEGFHAFETRRVRVDRRYGSLRVSAATAIHDTPKRPKGECTAAVCLGTV